MKKANIIWMYPLCTMVIFLMFLSISFKSIAQDSSETVKDIDGNVYKTVKIGTQIWMAENLKTTKFKDGTNIPLVIDDTIWSNPTPAFCYLNNNQGFREIYGALYNWYAASSGNLCPVGWHLPSNAEWNTLIKYLTDNGYGYEGNGSDIAKSMAATSGWLSNSTAGNVGNDQASNNRSGFTALPGGCRWGVGKFQPPLLGYWWSSTERDKDAATGYILVHSSSTVGSLDMFNKGTGFSVRCVKDNDN